jgi:16S rRNA (guanine(527)-N(7))-methyltransferase RsmG
LFHVKPQASTWLRCGQWAGFDLSRSQISRLTEYRQWLLTEGVAAGGIGPNEKDRIDNRHIGDSLLFAAGFDPPPSRVLDVGSGVGLPGIPLSIMMPETGFTLLDRSGRRVDLMRRVSRVLDLPNVEVIQGDVADWETTVDGIVSRASLSPESATTIFPRLLRPGGCAVIGGSWAAPPVVFGFDLLEVPAMVLDQTVWLLIMRVL